MPCHEVEAGRLRLRHLIESRQQHGWLHSGSSAGAEATMNDGERLKLTRSLAVAPERSA